MAFEWPGYYPPEYPVVPHSRLLQISGQGSVQIPVKDGFQILNKRAFCRPVGQPVGAHGN